MYYHLSQVQRKHNLSRANWKTIAIKRGNDQSAFSFFWSSTLRKTDENDFERPNLHLSIANSLSFNVWRKMNLKGLRIGRA